MVSTIDSSNSCRYSKKKNKFNFVLYSYYLSSSLKFILYRLARNAKLKNEGSIPSNVLVIFFAVMHTEKKIMECNPRLSRHVILPSKRRQENKNVQIKFLELFGILCPVKRSHFDRKTIDSLYKFLPNHEQRDYSLEDMYSAIRRQWTIHNEEDWVKLTMDYNEASDFEIKVLNDPLLCRRIQYSYPVTIMNYETVGVWHVYELVNRMEFWVNEHYPSRCRFHGIVQLQNHMTFNSEDVKNGVPNDLSYVQSFSDIMDSFKENYLEYDIHIVLIEERGKFMSILVQTDKEKDISVIEFIDPDMPVKIDRNTIIHHYLSSISDVVRKKENMRTPKLMLLPSNVPTYNVIPLIFPYLLLRLFHCQCIEAYHRHPELKRRERDWAVLFLRQEGAVQYLRSSVTLEIFQFICLDLTEFVTNIMHDIENQDNPVSGKRIIEACRKFNKTVAPLVQSNYENQPYKILNNALKLLQRSFLKEGFKYMLPPQLLTRLIAQYQNDPLTKYFESATNPIYVLNQIASDLFEEKIQNRNKNSKEYATSIMNAIFIRFITPNALRKMNVEQYMQFLLSARAYSVLSTFLKYIHTYNVQNQLQSSQLMSTILLEKYDLPVASNASRVWQRVRNCQAVVEEIELFLEKHQDVFERKAPTMKTNQPQKNQLGLDPKNYSRMQSSSLYMGDESNLDLKQGVNVDSSMKDMDENLKRLIIQHQTDIDSRSSFQPLNQSSFPITETFYYELNEEPIPQQFKFVTIKSSYIPRLLKEIPYMRFYAIGTIVATNVTVEDKSMDKKTRKLRLRIIITSLLEFFSHAESKLMIRMLCELMHQLNVQVLSSNLNNEIKLLPIWQEFSKKLKYCTTSVEKPEGYDKLIKDVKTMLYDIYGDMQNI